MTLPRGLQFSQSNLQDFVDCQRRFQLRHILHQAWPAVDAEPYLENERMTDQGAKFHRIVRQQLVGVPEIKISQSISDDDVMKSWWSNYLNELKSGILSLISEPGNQHFEEITLSVPMAEFQLIAKYDLLLIQPDGRLIIIDWKTSQNHPRRSWLADRLQTHVYPYVLTSAVSSLIGGNSPDPNKIEMIYWYTNQPEQVERFPYNLTEYRNDGKYLEELTTILNQKEELIYPLTSNFKRCLFCNYRSLCNRGSTPGDLHHLDEWLGTESTDEINLELDQIGEIEF